ncbi:RIB43A-like with coiled-coils protein 1 [Scyliorhinus canicula]|uniref:RIB43A-like with coiled-coils protein 1 n=1 Tax=Scyliorhinus canicula TaxID=7830 RepID=UPI0018F6BBAD|nr:RIB43A-like with coiled-coils protein 1 [Scyliorhinus canicula]XP_038637510.1 RIB43A-like with coiled-coils protein 1 [Scyliorhinus canicula]XP_038637512.1 RIB43A-like with coiled-coils protein 1 [Scyliorhinus canicula]
MYKLDLAVDPKQTAAIERRRNAELQRQSRIFNVKNRIIGVDRPFLDNQVLDKKTSEDRERLWHEAHDSENLRYVKTAQLLEAQEQERVRELNKEVDEYRLRYQQPENQREFDLWDPDMLKKDMPARVSDDDPRCGPSSLQKFAGEDLNEKARNKFQQQESRKWLTAQRMEKERAERDQKYADDLHHKKEMELDARALKLAEMEEEARRAIDTATLNYNMALAAEQAAVRDVARRQETDENYAEIGNHVYGDILTENPEVAVSAFGPHRVVTDRWKGMSPEQLEAIDRERRRQLEENKRRRMKEAQDEAEWDHQRILAARAALALQEKEAEEARRLRQELDNYNNQLAKEQLSHQVYLDKEVYTNPPTAQYFLQFNTSSR